MIKFVGLKNCDTCRKAKKWLQAEGIDFEYQDVRADGLAKEDVTAWANAVGWENLLNRRGTTWRQLDDAMKENVDEAKAIDLIVEHTSMMKRPVFVTPEGVLLGFKQDQMDVLVKFK